MLPDQEDIPTPRHDISRRDFFKIVGFTGAGLLAKQGLDVASQVGVPIAGAANEVQIFYKAEAMDIHNAVDSLAKHFAKIINEPVNIHPERAQTAEIDPQRARELGMPDVLVQVLKSNEYIRPELQKVLDRVGAAYESLESSGKFSLSGGVGTRNRVTTLGGQCSGSGDTPVMSWQVNLTGAPTSPSWEIVDKRILELFPHDLMTVNADWSRTGHDFPLSKGKINNLGSAILIGPENEESLLFGNLAYGIQNIRGNLVCGPNFIVATKTVRYRGGEAQGTDIPDFTVVDNTGVNFRSHIHYLGSDSPVFTDNAPPHLAGKDTLAFLRGNWQEDPRIDFITGNIEPNTRNSWWDYARNQVLDPRAFPTEKWTEGWHDLYKKVGLNPETDSFMTTGFAVLGVEGKFKTDKGADQGQDVISHVDIKKTFVFEVVPFRGHEGVRGVDPYRRELAIISTEQTGEGKDGSQSIKTILLPSKPGESFHIIGKVEDRIICARVGHKNEGGNYKGSDDVPATLLGLAVVGANGIEKQIDLPQQVKIIGETIRTNEYFRGPMVIPSTDNKSGQFVLYDTLKGETTNRGRSYASRELLRIPLIEIFGKDKVIPVWNWPVVDIQIDGSSKGGSGDQASEQPKFPVEREKVETPVFRNLDKNTVMIHIPGAGGNRASAEMSWFSPPWAKAFFAARGDTQAQADKRFNGLLDKMNQYNSVDHQMSRLGLQLREMTKEGMVVLPWETITDAEKNPFHMALALAAFIKTLPPEKKVILTGHSLGGMVVRSFLKMYQNGLLDESLKDRRVVGSVSISEGYMGDLIDTLVYGAVKRQNLNRIGAQEAKDIYDWVIKSLKDASTAGETDESKSIGEWLVRELKTGPTEGLPDDLGKKKEDAVKIVAEVQNQCKKALEILERQQAMAMEYIIRAGSSLVLPDMVTRVDANKLKARGLTTVTVRSPEDLLARNATISGGIDVLVNLDAQKQFKLQGTKIRIADDAPLISIPPMEDFGVIAGSLAGPAHSNHGEMATLVFGRGG